jgi:hypothetical protein
VNANNLLSDKDVLISTNQDLDRAYDQRERHHDERKASALTEQQQRCHQVFKITNYEEQKNINPRRVEGTCQWALQCPKYIRWWGSKCNDLLWISADPGCGKSVLARSIIDDHLEALSPGVTICYFFFKDHNDQNRLDTALCSMVHQLFSQRPHLLPHAIPSWKQNGEGLRHEVDDLWRILTTAGLADLSHQTICIFDALDECREKDQRRLIEKLRFFYPQTSSSTKGTIFKFLVTSRPYDHIQEGFRSNTDNFSHVHIKGEEENNRIHEEIDLVVKIKVKELAELVPLSADLHQRVKEQLLRMEHRTYLWLELAIDDIHTTFKNSLRPVEEPIRLIPRSVSEAYEKILCRVPPGQWDTVKKIFSIIVAAQRPLTIREMAIALGIFTRPKSRTTILAGLDLISLDGKLRRLCGLFVFTNNSKIYLIHQTAREFLITRRTERPESMTWPGCVNFQDAHRALSEICVAYLFHMEMQKGSCQFPTSTESCTGIDTFLSYSATYWIKHMRNTSGFESHFLRLAGSLCCAQQKPMWLDIVEPPFQYYRYANEPLPFFWVARWGLKEVAYLLLEDSKIQITNDVLKKAAANNKPAVIELLLDRKGDEINVTDSVVQEAAANEESGVAIMELLIERGGKEIKITDEVMQKAARNGKSGLAIIKSLVAVLDRGGNEVTITGKVMESAAANLWSGLKIIQYLLDRKDIAVRITPRVLRAVLEHPRWKDIVRLLRPRRYLIRRIIREKTDNHTRARLSGNAKWNIKRNKAKLNRKVK